MYNRLKLLLEGLSGASRATLNLHRKLKLANKKSQEINFDKPPHGQPELEKHLIRAMAIADKYRSVKLAVPRSRSRARARIKQKIKNYQDVFFNKTSPVAKNSRRIAADSLKKEKKLYGK